MAKQEMTVADLIEELQKVEDKGVTVDLVSDCCGCSMSYIELDAEDEYVTIKGDSRRG